MSATPAHAAASTAALERALRDVIRDVPDFPKPGILFRDITPVLARPELFAAVVEELVRPYRGDAITHVVGIESRGFILGAPAALALGAAFIPVRKPGKLPYHTHHERYALEYGEDGLEIHADACAHPARVLIVDDVLATGGTAAAACRLVERLGAVVAGCSFLLELMALGGRQQLGARPTHAVVAY